VVCDPRKNALLQDGSKSDRIDARKLAELLRGNQLSPVYHGDHGVRTLKELARSYLTLTQDLTRVMTRIKALYRTWAIPCSGTRVYGAGQRSEWLAKISQAGVQLRAERLYQIALMWHDSDTWQNLQQIWRLPFGTLIGGCLMTAQIAGGIGIQYPRTVRLASAVLCVVYLCFSLACIPDIIAASNIYERYGGSFFLFFSLLCSAIALYAATEANAARAVVFGRLARLGLGICAISFTLGRILLPRETAHLVPKWIPPNQMFWAILTTVAFGLAAIAILMNRQARLAMRLMTLMLALFGVMVWVPHLIAHPKAHFNWSECVLTFLVTGAAWVVADLKSF